MFPFQGGSNSQTRNRRFRYSLILYSVAGTIHNLHCPAICRALQKGQGDETMLNFHDHAAAIDEPKTARMEQRTKPRVKAQIQQAAALLGVDETTFVTSAALEQARLTIAEYERTLLTAEDCAIVLAALDASPEPTEALREAMALHEARVAHDG